MPDPGADPAGPATGLRRIARKKAAPDAFRNGLRDRPHARSAAYFKFHGAVLKAVLRLWPMTVKAETMAIEMPAAIKPYSTAVAPDASWAKRFNSPFMTFPFPSSDGRFEPPPGKLISSRMPH